MKNDPMKNKPTYIEDEPEFNWVNEALQATALLGVMMLALIAFLVLWAPRTGL